METKYWPCPFCGSENISIVQGHNHKWSKAQCNDCDACAGEVRYPHHLDVEEAEKVVLELASDVWNTRSY